MATYILTWNPAAWPWNYLARDADRVRRVGGSHEARWSTGNSRRIEPGDRLFILKQGSGSRGIFGAGTATSHVFEGEHFDEDRRTEGDFALYVRLRFDVLLDPAEA